MTSTLRCTALFVGLLLASAAAYQPSQRASRRDYLAGLLTTSAAAVVTAVAAPPAANAVIGSGECALGVGEGCVDRSEGNAYIQSLQEKSSVNKELYAQQARDAYYTKNYPDFFASIGKTLVKKQDGTYMAVDDAELEALQRDNKLTVQVAMAMGGKVTDVTQKPILVLKE